MRTKYGALDFLLILIIEVTEGKADRMKYESETMKDCDANSVRALKECYELNFHMLISADHMD